MKHIAATICCAILFAASPSLANGPRSEILTQLRSDASAADTAFKEFSIERGARLFSTPHSGGKPDTPACTSCHGTSALSQGLTRAGKSIAPMAVSVSPDRYTDAKKVAKWFRRNCKGVLGRECTAREKGDFLAFMSAQ